MCRLLRNHLYVKPQKCEFHVPEEPFLGFILRKGEVDPKKTQALQEGAAPKSVKEVQRFLGFANFYRKFIRGFSSVVAPLSVLTKKDGGPFRLNIQAELSRILSSGSLQHQYWFSLTHHSLLLLRLMLPTLWLGLFFLSAGKLHPCAFFSHRLSPTVSRYDVGDRELLAVKMAEWRHWLEGAIHPFLVWTDHRNLEQQAKRLNPRQARWAMFFSRFEFTLSY